MGITITVKDAKPKGRTRTSIDRQLRDDWGVSSFKNNGDKNKAEYLERKFKKRYGADSSSITAKNINKVR